MASVEMLQQKLEEAERTLSLQTEINRELLETVDNLQLENQCLLQQLEQRKAEYRTVLEELRYSATAEEETIEKCLASKQSQMDELKEQLSSERKTSIEIQADHTQTVFNLTTQLERSNTEITALKRNLQEHQLLQEKSREDKAAMEKELSYLNTELHKQKLLCIKLTQEVASTSLMCENLQSNVERLEINCSQWRRLYEEELNKTKDLTEELSITQCHQLYQHLPEDKQDEHQLVVALDQELITVTAEELSARPPSISSPATDHHLQLFEQLDGTECKKWCIELKSEVAKLNSDISTMDEQILKVAKQKYELQLQLEAWQNDIEHMIEKQLRTPILEKNNK